MRVRSIHLTDFKRFHDLTVDLSSRSTKIVALVGPNGSGKSSIFESFEEASAMLKSRNQKIVSYLQKSMHEGGGTEKQYDSGNNVKLITQPATLTRTSVYIRSAYRFTSSLNVNNVRTLPDAEEDQNRPQRLIDTDARLVENYERLIGRFFSDVYGQDITGASWINDNIAGINAALRAVLDISISSIGNPVNGKGSLYFDKGVSRQFPFENLSSGEKEVVDLVLDLYVKRDIYTDSIICVDEPELHLNTAIQRRLLVELEKLVPDNSQLWIATHSIGFLRALQEDLRDKTTVIDFSRADFDQPVVIKPIGGTRADWSRIFATALEDLTGLMAPQRIVYCEGRPDPAPTGGEQGLDADVYNTIFEHSHGDTLFVSSGGGGEVARNALLAMRILGKALPAVSLGILKDRDELSDADRATFLISDPGKRMLNRREIENYLFDKEVLIAFCRTHGNNFDEARYDRAVNDVYAQDLKLLQQEIKDSCAASGSIPAFKRSLAAAFDPVQAVYAELESSIFP